MYLTGILAQWRPTKFSTHSPNPNTETSPVTIRIFPIASGFSFFNLSNSYKKKHLTATKSLFFSKKKKLPTGTSTTSLNLSPGLFPFFARINRQISTISGHERNSFSMSTRPKNPVPPVMKTDFPRKNSGMV